MASALLNNKRRSAYSDFTSSILEAHEQERKRLSLELHDNVNQILSSCSLLLEAAYEGKGDAMALIKKSYDGVNIVIQEIRKLCHADNATSQNAVRLIDSIKHMVELVNLSGKIYIDFRHRGALPEPLSEEKVGTTVFRIIQEIMNNILRHSQASLVNIFLNITKSSIYLTVEDNGVGFDLLKVKKGLGLSNIQSRIELLHGTIILSSSPGAGTKIKAHIPL